MPKISLDNLERYDGHLKDWCDARFAERKVHENWHEAGPSGAVSFYPVPNRPIDPVVNFAFIETLPSGTKGPDNPSTITGVSSVKVTRCGKNIIPYPYSSPVGTDSKGITWSVASDGTVTATGTASGATTFFMTIPYWNLYSGNMNQAHTLPAGTYYYSGCPSGGDWNKYRIRCYFDPDKYSNYITVSNDIGSGGYITLTKPCIVSFGCEINTGFPGENNTLTFKPQLELVSPVSDFEPYSGTDYTVNLGGTYYGGSVDLSTGIMTVTQIGYELDSSLNWWDTSAVYAYRTVLMSAKTLTSENYGQLSPLFRSSHLVLSANATDQMPNYSFLARSDGNVIVATGNLSMQSFKDWLDAQKLAGTPVVVTYPLYTSQIVQLTPQQIYSLSQFDSYIPRVNTIYSNQQSILVRYPKSPIVTGSELDNAILSLGGD